MTHRRRKLEAFWHGFHNARQRHPTLGEIMRGCGFSCRSNAKRTLNDLQKMGSIPNY